MHNTIRYHITSNHHCHQRFHVNRTITPLPSRVNCARAYRPTHRFHNNPTTTKLTICGCCPNSLPKHFAWIFPLRSRLHHCYLNFYLYFPYRCYNRPCMKTHRSPTTRRVGLLPMQDIDSHAAQDQFNLDDGMTGDDLLGSKCVHLCM